MRMVSVPSKRIVCDMHKYRESLPMPDSDVVDVDAVLTKLKAEWPGKDYDLLQRNCCTFSDTFCVALNVGNIPTWVGDT